MPKTKRNLAIEITAKEENGFFKIAGHIVTQDDRDAWVLANVQETSAWNEAIKFPVISCQGDREAEHLYGFQCEMRDMYSVSLAQAKEIVKVLSKIERGMKKLREEFGEHTCFADYLLRVASVLRIKSFIIDGEPVTDMPFVKRWVSRQETRHLEKAA